MAFVPIAGGAEAVIHLQLAGQDIENTLWFVSELGTVTATDCQALGEALANWVDENYLPQLPEAVTGNFIAVRAQDVEGGPGFDVGLLGSAGGIVDDPMPNEVTLAISFRTAGTGRGSRGRNYVAGLPRSNVTGNLVDSALITNLVTAYANINVQVAATGFVHAVMHRFSGFTIVDGKKVPTPPSAGVAQPVLAYIVADNVVDAQRRRGPGRGR